MKVLSISVCSSCIWFPLGNLTSSLANHLKFIHKVRDNRRHTKFCFGFSLFWSYARFLFQEAKQGHLYPMITFLLFSGFCLYCKDNTTGYSCERCMEDFIGNPRKNQPCIHKGMSYVFYRKSALYTQRYGLCLL